MAVYYYQYEGELQKIDLTKPQLVRWKKSNPGMEIKSQSNISQKAKTEASKRIANAEAIKNRRMEYPALGDVVDEILKGFNDLGLPVPDALQAVMDQRQAIKDKYPKV